MLNMTETTQKAVLEGNVPAKAVAMEIEKPYHTLMRELNPYDSGAKLGVQTFLEILRITGNVEPLRKLARELGYGLVTLGDSAGERFAALQDETRAGN
jgi:hypothetical protein